MNKTLREAKARVAEVQARLDAYDLETDRERAKEAVARKRIDRARVPAIYLRSDGETVDLLDMARVKPGYIGRDIDHPRDLPAAIEAGTIKLETDGSVQRAAKTVAKNLRVMAPADARALARLDARISKARDERDTLIKASHARGTQLTVTEVAKHAATMHALHKALPVTYGYGRRGGPDDWRRREIESAMADAVLHQRFVNGDMDAETMEAGCPCRVCQKARNEAAIARTEAARVAALPRVAVADCPACHKGHRVPLDTRDVTMTGEDGAQERLQGAPVFTCPVAKRLILHRPLWAKEQAKRARAEAKAEAERAKALRRDGVWWTCPGCEEPQQTLIGSTYFEGNPDYKFLECEACEQSFDLRVIKTSKRRPAVAKEAA